MRIGGVQETRRDVTEGPDIDGRSRRQITYYMSSCISRAESGARGGGDSDDDGHEKGPPAGSRSD